MRSVSYVVAVSAFLSVWSVLSLASAQDVAGVRYTAADDAVLDQLDAMLDQPVERYAARSRDTPVSLAAHIPLRFVVVVHRDTGEVHAFEPARRRHAKRALPPSLARGSAYAIAGIAYELLELVRTAPEGSPEIEIEESLAPAAASRSHIDGFHVGLGARLTVSPGGDALLVDLLGQLELMLRARTRLLLPIGLFAAGLGRDSASEQISSKEVVVDYRRTDLALRFGAGTRRRHVVWLGHLVLGLGLVHTTTNATTGGSGTPVEDEVTRTPRFFAGLMGEARVELPKGFALGTTVGVDSTFASRDYGAVGLEAFHEGAVRLTFALSLLWGRPSR